MPPMDIQSGVIALVILAIVFAFVAIRGGLRAIRSARKMTFYRLRRQREVSGWRLLGIAVIMIGIAVVLPVYGLPIAYQYFPPSPTPSLTPSITPIPSLTLIPTITLSPTITDTAIYSATPTVTPTPFIPAAIQALFQSSVTPNPDAVFSPLQFTTAGSGYPAVNPSTDFQNPVAHLYAIFTYDQMLPGVQWTALWMREGQLVFYETKPWNGGTGGSGYTDWNPSPDKWLPGIYEVQVFVGDRFEVSGRFVVEGIPATAVATRTAPVTFTIFPSPRPIYTLTPTPTPPLLSTPAYSVSPTP